MNKDATVALVMIIKDDSELDFLDRCLQSFTPFVDGLYVAVTGPSGQHSKIHKLIKKFKGVSKSFGPDNAPEIYFEKDGVYTFANFAAARNRSFSLVDKEFDFLIWADADDMLIAGEELKNIVNIAKEKKYDSVLVNYLYDVDLDEETGKIKRVKTEHLRERIVRPGVFKWVSRLHEVMIPKDPNYNPRHTVYNVNPEKNQNLCWVHLPEAEETKNTLDRNRFILNIQAEEENYEDPRTIFYLAKVEFQLDNMEAAEDYLKQYLSMSGWDEERSNALEYLGLIYSKAKNYSKAIPVYHGAIEEFPTMHMPYIRLADAYYQLGMKAKGDFWFDAMWKLLPEPTAQVTIGHTFEIKLLAATVGYNKALMEQDLEKAEYFAQMRADLLGEDDGPLANVLATKDLNQAAIAVNNLSLWLKNNEHEDLIEPLLNLMPEQLSTQRFFQKIRNSIVPPAIWGDKTITYFASFGGPHFEKWDGNSLTTGIGGSETAVIELAREWTKLGYEVTVFCDCEKQVEIDGVKYVPYYYINWKDQFNTFILWRSPHLLDIDIKAKTLLVDLHDVISPLDWPESRWSKVDKIFVKSEYHRNNLPNIPDEKFEIVGNGIRE